MEHEKIGLFFDKQSPFGVLSQRERSGVIYLFYTVFIKTIIAALMGDLIALGGDRRR